MVFHNFKCNYNNTVMRVVKKKTIIKNQKSTNKSGKVGRPKITNAKKSVLQLRLNESEMNDITQLAKELKMTYSETIRLVVKKYRDTLKNQEKLFDE